MTRLILAELFKLRKRSMTRILAFVLVGLLVIMYLLLFAVSKVEIPGAGAGGPPFEIQDLLGLRVALPFAYAMLSGFGVILAVILLASSMGNEYNWRTIRTMVISSESRFKLLGAKLISGAIIVLVGMIIGVAAGFIMSLITTAIGGNDFDFSFFTGSYAWDQFLQFWRTFYVMIPYVLLGFLFAIVGRSAMPGIGLGIGIIIIESIITTFMVLAGGWIADIPDYLLANNVNAINALATLPEGFSGGFGGADFRMPGVTHAYVTLAIYSIVFLFISFFIFRKRDITG